MKKRILLIGATSAIAQEVAKLYAGKQQALYLVGRNAQRLAAIATDLSLRHNVAVEHHVMDLNDVANHQNMIDAAVKALGGLDTVLIAHGTLSNQAECEASFTQTRSELETNFVNVVSLLTLFANYFAKKGSGCIAVISSVAGDRGRKSNYVYGAAKGALNIFMQGLRNRLHAANVDVVTIKPGFVDTPMTAAFKKGILWAKPEYVAKKIVTAISKRRSVVYVPFYWEYIMTIIKLIPEKVFRKLSL
jgi:decaprenylphospho-beta-D-erythro-pentofuranosid-2-ulose 2-reductase